MHLIFEILYTMLTFFGSFFTSNSLSLATKWTEFIIFIIIRIFFLRLGIFQIHCIVKFLYKINNFRTNFNITICISDFRHVFWDNCHHSNWSSTRNFNFEERMRMGYCCFTLWAKIEIFAYAALVSITIDWSFLTTITLDAEMHS